MNIDGVFTIPEPGLMVVNLTVITDRVVFTSRHGVESLPDGYRDVDRIEMIINDDQLVTSSFVYNILRFFDTCPKIKVVVCGDGKNWYARSEVSRARVRFMTNEYDKIQPVDYVKQDPSKKDDGFMIRVYEVCLLLLRSIIGK